MDRALALQAQYSAANRHRDLAEGKVYYETTRGQPVEPNDAKVSPRHLSTLKFAHPEDTQVHTRVRCNKFTWSFLRRLRRKHYVTLTLRHTMVFGHSGVGRFKN